MDNKPDRWLPLPILGSDACKICKGACCKNVPGESLPDRWLRKNGTLDVQKVREALMSKKWVIDLWDDTDPARQSYYLRPSHSKSSFPHDFSWNRGNCVFLTDAGCSLSTEDRPEGCLALEAKIYIVQGTIKKNNCSYKNGSFKEKAAKAWRPWSRELRNLGGEIDID